MITDTTVAYVKNALKNGRRMDGRKTDEIRPIHIDHEVSVNAEGCARVRIGKTEVVCGVKFGLGEPYPDSPEEGAMSTSVEFPPLGDPEFEAGMPGADEVEAARVVDRCIRESHAIDFRKLCIEPGKKCYMAYIDIFVINNDGNLIDACGLAAIAALKHAKLPGVVKEADDYKIDAEKSGGNLELESLPISVTVRKGENGVLIVDPSREEEKALPARLTVGSKDNGNIASLQMGGAGQFSPEEVTKIAQLAVEIAQNLRKAHFKS